MLHCVISLGRRTFVVDAIRKFQRSILGAYYWYILSKTLFAQRNFTRRNINLVGQNQSRFRVFSEALGNYKYLTGKQLFVWQSFRAKGKKGAFFDNFCPTKKQFVNVSDFVQRNISLGNVYWSLGNVY